MLFAPNDARLYECKIPAFLGDATEPYIFMEAQGKGDYPRLTFDTRECVLPPVPLGITSHATFYIINMGYDNLEITHKLPADDNEVPIKIEFPEGNLIGIAKERLPVVVSFAAHKSISFTAKIDFIDELGNRFSQSVSGTADNCLLTTTGFYNLNNRSLAWKSQPDKPLSLEVRDYRVVSAAEALGPLKASPSMIKYLNITTARGPFTQIARQLQANGGRQLFELLELLAGKQIGRMSGKVTNSKLEMAQSYLQAYDSMLVQLRAQGALINAIKPEHLLEFEDFSRIITVRTENVNTVAEEDVVAGWMQVEDAFSTYSSQAWHTLISQMFKVFVLSRVTFKAFKALPNMAHVKVNEAAVASSNFYSTPEMLLLTWLSANLQQAFPGRLTQNTVTNFDRDMRSSLVLYSVIVNYWPSMLKHRSDLHQEPEVELQFVENAQVVCRCLEEMDIPFKIAPQDILQPKAEEMLVLALFLFTALPQFQPRAVVSFTGKLNEKQMKQIELSNPTPKMVSYTVKLEGHKDFSIETKSIKIQPKSSTKVSVRCHPVTSTPKDAYLILTNSKDGSVNASTLVFHLKSQVNTRAPVRVVKVDSPQYDLKVFDFTIANPFPADCDFSVRLLHEPAQPKEPPQEANRSRPDSRAMPGSRPDSQGMPVDLDPGKSRKKDGAGWDQSVVAHTHFPEPIGIDLQRFRLKLNGVEKLRGFFLPFTHGTHYCTIIMSDRECGEFCYQLECETKLPAPFLEHKVNLSTDKDNSTDILIPFVNHQLEQAKKTYLDKHPMGKDKEMLARLKMDIGFANMGDRYLEFLVTQSNNLLKTDNSLTVSQPNPQLLAKLLAQEAAKKAELGKALSKRPSSATSVASMAFSSGGRKLLTSASEVRVILGQGRTRLSRRLHRCCCHQYCQRFGTLFCVLATGTSFAQSSNP